ncbi:MAG TPA: hypothetical protein ENH55_17655 [Aurantimonas coralicida]|uniref:Sulfotransferase domain-containing protein n=2 Tax=root TaxID=1 RepID=A0A9C9TFD1_9HYPH|nr:hypothetical protein [Aurantimonas coralicida]HET99071.1 hypothetical protein [Aurantimonas coralicida]
MVTANLFIVGVQKGGTTTLYEQMRRHPDIAFGDEKELHILDDEELFTRHDVDLAAAYSRRFAAETQTDAPPRYFCDGTPIYSYWPNSLERLKAYNPDAKLIFLLRDPVERAFSHWRMEYARGLESLSFPEAIREGRLRVYSDPTAPGHHRVYSYVERGFYGRQFRRILDLFPREQVLVLDNRELRQDQAGTLGKIWSFLELPAPEAAPAQIEANAAPSFNYGYQPDPRDGRHLYSLYAADIAEFSELSGLDVSHWGTDRRFGAPKLARLTNPRQREDGGIGVLVLGMHRSGTSAVTGVLAELGVPAAGELYEAQPYNKKGIFENKTVHAFHDRVLKHFGSRWDDPMPVDLAWVDSPAGAGFVSELAAIIDSELLAESTIFAVKDPRMCRLIPLWRKALAKSGIDPRVIIPLRHPLEVAGSLRSRDAFPRAKSFLLWLEHILAVERETRGLARSFVSYDALMRDWRSVMGKTANDLSLAYPKELARAERGIDAFLTPDLRNHTHHGEIGAATRLDALVTSAWDTVQSLIVDEADAEARDRLDALARSLGDAAGLYGPYLAWEFDTLNRASADLAEAEARIAKLTGDVDYLYKERDTLTVERDRVQRAIDAIRAQSEQRVLDAEQRVLDAQNERDHDTREVRERSEAALGNMRYELDRLSREAAVAAQRCLDSEAHLAAMEASGTWRATRPVRNFLDAHPGFRRWSRRSAKLVWWAVTLQLPSRLRQRRALLSQDTGGQRALTTLSGSPRRPLPRERFPEMLELRAFEPTARIAAVVHLYYVEMWPELREALRAIPEKIDVILTVASDLTEAERRMIFADFPDAQIVRFENRGRDILPLMALADAGILARYELICKIHAKKSLHMSDGETWRRQLLSGILGSRALVERILSAFGRDIDLGIVVANGQIFGSRREHWVDNEERVLSIGSRLGLETIPADAIFPGGSMYWIRPFIFDTLNGLKLAPDDFEEEPLARDGTTAHALERLIGLVTTEAGMTIAESGRLDESRAAPAQTEPSNRVVAYYLPQYHPTPENDRWWGKGFTEWTNVSRALPMFKDHRQPRLPSDLGFYDLRLAEARQAQADLASRYGLHGFCYYYYWFDGEGVLRLPLDEMLKSGKPELPFMLCWANEPWSRNWDGGNRELLMPQNYEPGWAKRFARDIAPLMQDERYIRVDGRPMLMIYRVMHIPDRRAAIGELRTELRHLGIGEIHISAGWVGFVGDEEPPTNAALAGIDSWSEFPPHRLPAAEISGEVRDLEPAFAGKVYSYRSAVEYALSEMRQGIGRDRHRAVMMGWDNTARRLLNAHAFHGATPALFRRWLRAIVLEQAAIRDSGDRLIFVNAWNEWAEGTYLEPDRDFGHGWLSAVASANGWAVHAVR